MFIDGQKSSESVKNDAILVTITGHSHPISPTILARLTENLLFLQFFLVCMFLVAFAPDSKTLTFGSQDVPYEFFFVSRIAFLALAWLWCFAAFQLFAKLVTRGRLQVVLTPLITLPLAGMVALLQWATAHFFATSPQAWMPQDALETTAVLLLMDFVFVRYVCPTLAPITQTPEPALPQSSAAQSPLSSAPGASMTGEIAPSLGDSDLSNDIPAPLPMQRAARIRKTVMFNGRSVALDALISIHAEDHNVRLVYDETIDVFRARLKDIVETLGPEAGMQINRSCWVSFAGINRLQSVGKHQWILLRNGNRVKITASRKILVAAAWDTYRTGGRITPEQSFSRL